MTKGWYGDKQQHSMAKKGIKTATPDSNKIKYVGTGTSMHGYMDRSYDTYLFKDKDGEDIEVVIFSEPDFESIGESLMYNEITEKEAKEMEDEFYKDGEVQVIWSGAVDFIGTESEFKESYPELYNELF